MTDELRAAAARGLARTPWACECGCCPDGPDIVAARTNLEAALDEIDRLRAERDAMRARVAELERWHSFHQTQPLITDEDVAAIVEAYETGDPQ